MPALARGTVTGGARHVWLDRTVRVRALDHNLDQIGAPRAWAAGATGKGTKVAVLDTGVDATHPDLTGRILAQKNFSQSPDTVDRFGHGTHGAATIAGTGAAANGERRASPTRPACWSARSSATTGPAASPTSSPAWSGPRPAPGWST